MHRFGEKAQGTGCGRDGELEPVRKTPAITLWRAARVFRSAWDPSLIELFYHGAVSTQPPSLVAERAVRYLRDAGGPSPA
jgi:hypothetical protein